MDKTPDEIKKGLECCISSIDTRHCARCPYGDGTCRNDLDSLEKDALAYIQQLEAQVPRWISVKEKLPERGTWVLCCGAKGGMFLSDWVTPPFGDEETAYCSVPNARCGRNAKYWMPLPEQPKEVQP